MYYYVFDQWILTFSVLGKCNREQLALFSRPNECWRPERFGGDSKTSGGTLHRNFRVSLLLYIYSMSETVRSNAFEEMKKLSDHV